MLMGVVGCEYSEERPYLVTEDALALQAPEMLAYACRTSPLLNCK